MFRARGVLDVSASPTENRRGDTYGGISWGLGRGQGHYSHWDYSHNPTIYPSQQDFTVRTLNPKDSHRPIPSHPIRLHIINPQCQTSTLTPCAVSQDVAPPKYFIIRLLIHPSTSTYMTPGGNTQEGYRIHGAQVAVSGVMRGMRAGGEINDEFGLLCRNNIHT